MPPAASRSIGGFMLRIIAGIIVGWIVMAVLVMATFGITILAMGGLENVLQPGSWWTTDTFNIIVLIGGFIAAIVGGLVCGLIARKAGAGYTLATIMVVFGVGYAVMNFNEPDPPARSEPATMQAMMEHGKEPNWFAISKTVAAVIGLIIGSSLVKKRSAGSP
jgi:hypothetical protein